MTENTDREAPRCSDQLHPWIYRTIVALAMLLVLAAWGFSGNEHTGLALTVVSAFFIIAIAIPVLLWRIWRHNANCQTDQPEPLSFARWCSRDLEICEGRIKGKAAMVEVLLPIVAVAFGMAAFALVLHFDIG
jgi:hypothetical protein